MSVAAMTAVWRYSQAPDVTSLLVLIAMADWCDDEGYCFPSHRAICLKTGASASTVKRAIRQHIARGELERVSAQGHTQPGPREFVGRTGFKPTNLYRVVLVDKLGSPRPPFLARNGVRETRVTARTGRTNRGQAAPRTGASQTQERGSAASASLLCTRQIDTSEDPSEVQAGAAPPTPPPPTDDDVARNVGVITKLAHEVLDLFAETDDVTYGDVVEAVKRRCAILDIAYRSDVVTTAIESALYQRQRGGKPSTVKFRLAGVPA